MVRQHVPAGGTGAHRPVWRGSFFALVGVRSWPHDEHYLALRRQWHRPRSTERLRQPREHYKVGVKLDTLQPAHAERQKPVVVFQPPELTLNSASATVERAEAFRVARDARVVTAHGFVTAPADAFVFHANRNHRVTAPLFAGVVGRAVVVAAIHGGRFWAVAASVESVKQRRNEVGFVPLFCFYLPRKRQSGLRTDRKLQLESVKPS